jgi:dTMP kinase
MGERTEALLMTASRAQLTHDVIIPSLDSGLIVIADRFKDSTLAYQGGGRGLDINYLLQLNDFATYELDPDITFFIDVTQSILTESKVLEKYFRKKFENNILNWHRFTLIDSLF